MSYMRKKAGEAMRGEMKIGSSSSSSSDGKGMFNRNKDEEKNDSGGGKKDGDDNRMYCFECLICIAFILIIIGLILGFAAQLWLVGDVKAASPATGTITYQIGISKVTYKLSPELVSSGQPSTETISLSSDKCSTNACKGWNSAGKVARVLLIMFLLCLVPALILACLFCAGESVFESIGDCLPCGVPGCDVPDVFPCATTAAAAGPRYLSLFPSLCCDFMMFLLAALAAIVYKTQTNDDLETFDGADKLKLGISFYFVVVMAIASCCLGCVHSVLVVVYPAIAMAEAADEAGDSASGIMGKIDVPGI
ncbi:uncharacterized protein AMSG_10536 [Thecamonas trahens ATCC 50062]|uniref:Transmembrane protein n=1 Tax=Thecamonas trahens ATCC 50062 TaxID=461836 RepID=A0A0L0DS63_THETB|nr:hypothetical protein AMSG_10536 [Thecamonas trahens ATCC 50062]KNC54881.1 hypothetical protein AMSG_10536 [Thecamonas trahens ATCC 50062]|eukprot:XP_013753476.1 hypothetical protein AMSG_10536 [Thecamonas trahens ATCC 50062]